ncbi:MAG: ABC transporter permease [Anaerolineales bacterium]|nr:ABC transporter permease [Anaerolineales bacterium]MDW8163009.1 ABC transporter permease [Anaerolineales bacterium]
MGFEAELRHSGGSVEGDRPSTLATSSHPVTGWRKASYFLRALLAKPASALGFIIFTLFLLLALFGPLIAPYGVNEQIAADAGQPPSAKHWFGTDNLGRDVFSRVVLGAREILGLAGLGTAIAVFFGTTIGLATGYLGGWFDEILMRIFDGLLAMPLLLLALLLLGTLGPSKNSVLLVIIIVYTPIVSRVVRSAVLSVRQRGFIEAARLRGEHMPYILFREILPSVLPALAVEAALRFSYAIFLVASLGFLGVGVQPPSPDWGLMVREARNNVNQIPWAMYYPAAAIALIVIGVNLLADGIKRVLLESQ